MDDKSLTGPSSYELNQKPRALSSFFFEELLYDYVSDGLEPKRKTAMDLYLVEHPEAMPDVNSLKFSIEYCDELSAVKISSEFFSGVMEDVGWFNKTLSVMDWRNWPDFARWGTEAFLISVAVTLILVFIPWDQAQEILPSIPQQNQQMTGTVASEKMVEEPIVALPRVATKVSGSAIKATASKQKKIVFDRVKKRKGENSEQQQKAQKVMASSPSEVFEPAKSKKPNKRSKILSTGESPKVNLARKDKQKRPIIEKRPDLLKATSSNEPKTSKLALKEPPNPNTVVEPFVKKPIDQKAVVAVAGKDDPKIESGTIYRIQMKVSHLEAQAQSLHQQLFAIKAKKAGRVELGWKKPKGRYYHFTIPEQNYSKLNSLLKSFGTVILSKDRHWRVMPEGVIRIIMFIENSSLKQSEIEKNKKPTIEVQADSEATFTPTKSIETKIEKNQEKIINQ